MKTIYPLLLLLLLFSCKKDPLIIQGNEAPQYADVPTALVKNYINRLYIDLIGREPLDTEMEADLLLLKSNQLAPATRAQIVKRLQSDTTYIAGDSSYAHAYYQRFYDLCKIRLLEGVADGEINQRIGIYQQALLVDSLNGDLAGMEENKLQIEKLENIINAKIKYRNGQIEIHEVYQPMLDNYFYDFINMNTFNFINASFDDLFFRYPTSFEFQSSFDMIEFNTSSTLFGEPGQNKADFIQILTGSREFYQGLIIWAYNTLLARDPTTAEAYELMTTFYTDHNFQKVQEKILITDEYANF